MNHGHRWTTDKFQRLIGMWLRGDSEDKICREFDLSLSGLNKVVQRLRKNGIPLPLRKNGHKPGRHNRLWTQEEVEVLVRMYGAQALILKLRNEEGVPVRSLGQGKRRLWDSDRLKEAIAGRELGGTGKKFRVVN